MRLTLLAGGGMAVLLGCHVAYAESGNGFPRVSVSDQMQRDSERSRILQQELTTERVNLAKATAEHAERLTHRDATGVELAEQAQRRARTNIMALEREIQLTDTARGRVSGQDRHRPEPTQRDREPGTESSPWWDVYGRLDALSQSTNRNSNHSRLGVKAQ